MQNPEKFRLYIHEIERPLITSVIMTCVFLNATYL